VDGVGENTAQNLADNYPRYIDIPKSDPSTFTVVDGVGEATAKELYTELTPIDSDAGDATTEGNAEQINPPDTEGQADLTNYSWSSE
jgi:NAD-dependent DNA ligase